MKHLILAVLCSLSFMLTAATKPDFVVAADGSGNFKTVQEAINAVPDFRKVTTVIFIKKGIYKEKIVLPGSKQMVSLVGESRDETILTYDDYAQKKNIFGEEKGTSGSSSFYIYGNEFSAENLTFENSSGPVGQAVALWAGADKLVFNNCRFLGFQDTLYTYGANNRQFYKHCYIEGTVDFIFGSSTAWFEQCIIFAKKGGGYLTAASTPDTVKYGYVFNHCTIKGDAPASSYYLGRPWRPYAKTAFLSCILPSLIKPEGWHNWDKVSNEKTAVYAEYGSTGAGGDLTKRVQWAKKPGNEELKAYTFENVFRGWIPPEK